MKKDGRTASLIMLISSMLIFGTIGLVRTWIPLASSLIACIRGITGAIFLLIFMLLTGRKPDLFSNKKLTLVQLISGALIGVNWILLFEAYNYTSVPTATLCYYMEPTIVVLLSPLLLKEKMTLKKGICTAVSLAGMVLISGIFEAGENTGDFRGVLFGLGAAVLYSAVVILNKRYPSEDYYTRTFVQLAAAGVVLLPYVLLTVEFAALELTARTVILLLIAGIVHTGIAYALYFGSMSGLSGQSVAVLSYIDPVSALILSAIFLDQTLSFYGITGAVLIIGAALAGEIKLGKKMTVK